MTFPKGLTMGREVSVALDSLLLVDPTGTIPEEKLVELLGLIEFEALTEKKESGEIGGSGVTSEHPEAHPKTGTDSGASSSDKANCGVFMETPGRRGKLKRCKSGAKL